MLGIIEIEGEEPKQSVVKKTITYKGGFFYIKFKVESAKDFDLLWDIFWVHMNDYFSGFSKTPKFENNKLTLNEEQTIYYDYQTNEINIKS
jgi:hypothetical protein